MPVGHLFVFFGKMSIQILCPFFNLKKFFDVKLYEFSAYLGYWNCLQISSPIQ